MASSHDETCPRDLLQGLVAGTSPPVFADLNCRLVEKQALGTGFARGVGLDGVTDGLKVWSKF